jgi:hypothetical protein
LTIDRDTNFYVGTSQIVITQTLINGIEVIVDSIVTMVTPSVIPIYRNLPHAPVDPTRGNPPVTSDEFMLIHPFMVVEADVYNNFSSVTSADFWDLRPSVGNVVISQDRLFINADFNTNIMLNYTNGTNFANYSTVPTAIDLTEFSAFNFTYWSNTTSNVMRFSTFRQTTVFYWIYETATEHYFTTQTLNNTTPFDWINVYWRVSLVEETKPERVTVYDNNNKAFLVVDEHYESTDYHFKMSYDWFNSSINQTYTFSYYNVSDPDLDEPTLRITSLSIKDYDGADHWSGSGTWKNSYSVTYEGRIIIVIENLKGIIDPDSVILINDITGEPVPSAQRPVAGNSIYVGSNYVGTVGVNGEARYTVYFQYLQITETGVPALYATWYFWAVIITLIGIMLVGFFIESGESKRLWLAFWAVILIIFMFIGLISYYLNT